MIHRVHSAVCALVCIVLVGCQATEQSGQQSATAQHPTSEIPLTASEEDGIRDQIARNWNLGSLAGSPNLDGMVVELRVHLLPDGTITTAELVNQQPGNPDFRLAANSAIRAVMISSPLKLPPGKAFTSLNIRFYPGEVVR